MSLRRILLLLAVVPVLIVAAAWYWLLHTESGARWAWMQAESATGSALTAAEVSGDLTSGVSVRGIEFTNDAVELAVDTVSLSARIQFSPLRVIVGRADASGFSLRILRRDSDKNAATDLHGIFAKLRLPFELVVGQLDVDVAVFDGLAGGKRLVIDALSLAGRWQDAIRIDRLQATAAAFDAAGSGQLSLSGENEVTIDADVVAKPALTRLDEAIAVAAEVHGSIDDLRITASTPEPETSMEGRLIGLGGDLAWELDLRAPSLVIPAADLPPLFVVASAHGDTRTLVAEGDVAFSGTDMQVGIAADIDMRAGAISADLDWRDAHWPVGKPEPRVESRVGQLSVSGSIDDWAVAGTLALVAPQLPPGRFTIDGEGDRDAVRISIVEGNVLGGTIQGRAEYSWRQPRPFAASLETKNVRTEAVLPAWPAVLSGKVDLSGQQRPLRLSADLRDVNGRFRDRPLVANGRVDYEDRAVRVANLELRHGESKARLDGQLYAAAGLTFDVFIDDLGLYVDGGFGELRAAGAVSLQPDAEFLRLDAASDLMGYRDLRIGGLRIEDAGDLGTVMSVEAAASSLAWGNVEVEQVLLTPHIGRQDQSIALDILTNGLRMTLSMRGALDDWKQSARWTGEIDELELHHEEFNAQLQQAAPVVLSAGRAEVDRLCLSGARGIGLCADAGWDSSDGIDVDARLSSVPIDLVNAFVDTRLEFDQVVGGEFSWHTGPRGRSGGRADLKMTAGTIVSIDDPERTLSTGESRLGFDIDEDDLRGGIIDLPLPGQGQVRAAFQVLDVAETGGAGLDGEIDIDLADIGIALPFLRVLDDAGGALRADIDVGGTVETPVLAGTITLEDGSISYLPIGLRLEEIDLNSSLNERGEIDLTGSFRAGEGRGQIRTRADRARTLATGIEVTLRGHNLTVIDVPDVKAIANTDIRVGFDGETLDVDGTLIVPRARIVPSSLGTSRVYESEDVVVIAGELPRETDYGAEAVDIRIVGSLEATLGDNVIIDLGVVETSVSGSTLLTWTGDPIPIANGQYDVDGEILAFGQRLEITEGSVQFPDVPADDPYLRIRAEREIFGNTQVRRAGVLVAGSLSRPTIEAYTMPITTEERALTLLVTGSDFDYERGIGAVDFGTYIAPRVYASYGIGLFDNENVIRVRYDLQRGFGVTFTSGQKESGLDLSYRFEN